MTVLVAALLVAVVARPRQRCDLGCGRPARHVYDSHPSGMVLHVCRRCWGPQG